MLMLAIVLQFIILHIFDLW